MVSILRPFYLAENEGLSTVLLRKSLINSTTFRFEPRASPPQFLKQKKRVLIYKTLFSAENEGFEPPVPLGTTVFKTAAIDHSANSPRQK